MRSAWARLWAAFRMELRLQIWHWSFPALHLLWGGYLIYTTRTSDLGTARYALTDTLWTTSAMLLTLVSLFVAAAGASRSARSRFAALEDSYPTGAELLLGRWLAGLLGVFTAVLEPLALAWRQGPPASFWAGAPEFLGQILVLMLVATAAAWAVVEWLGNRRWVYPLLIMGWLVVAMAAFTLRSTSVPLPWLPLVDFAHIVGPSYSETWGWVVAGSLPLWASLCYLGLGLALLAGAVGRLRTRRNRRPSAAATLALCLSLAVAVTGAARYVMLTQGQSVRAHDFMGENDQTAVGAQTDPQAAFTYVTAYDLTADLSDPERLQMKAQVTVRNGGDAPMATATFTLNRDLTVTAADLPYERQGHVLKMKLVQPLAPGQSRTLSLAYAGHVWSMPGWQPPTVYWFTSASGVRLSVNAGWYPLPGRVSVHPDSGDLLQDTAAVRLHVQAPAGWQFVSNLSQSAPGEFQASAADQVTLLGSPRLAMERIGDVTLVAARDDMPGLRAPAAEYARALTALRGFFPAAAQQRVTLFVSDWFDPLLRRDMQLQGDHALIVMVRQSLTLGLKEQRMQFWVVGQDLYGSLWRAGKPTADPPAEVGMVLWLYHRCGGDAQKMAAAVAEEGDYPAAAELVKVYASQGEAGLKRLVQRLHDQAIQGSDLDGAALAAWIRAEAVK